MKEQALYLGCALDWLCSVQQSNCGIHQRQVVITDIKTCLDHKGLDWPPPCLTVSFGKYYGVSIGATVVL